MKKAGIIGCGWLGTRVALQLMPEYKIWATTRSHERSNELGKLGILPQIVSFNSEFLQETGFPSSPVSQSDVLIIAVNFSKKQPTEQLLTKFQNIAAFIGPYTNPLFFMSSTGIYPQEATWITEDTFPASELHSALWEVEQLATQLYPQVNILRLGGLMGDDRFLSKYSIKDTHEPVNHIHYTDVAGIISKMTARGISSQTYNAVAPQHPQKQQVIDFQTTGTFDKEVQAKGRKVSSEKLIAELGYQFIYPDPIYFRNPETSPGPETPNGRGY